MRYIFCRFPGGLSKAVTLSFDDDTKHDVRFARTITKAGLKCTFNLCNPSQEEISDRLTVKEVNEEILAPGHEIAVHGFNHRANGIQTLTAGIKDVLDCRLFLEKTFGRIVQGMAYPDSGITNFSRDMSYEKIRSYLQELGIVYSRSLGQDNDGFSLPVDWYQWIPTAHHTNPKLMEYITKFNEPYDRTHDYIASRNPMLFYLWGHSFEFDSNNNWELLDEICEKLGGKDDVWYATNGEIYAYVTAFNSLVFSADESMVYNPSLQDVYMEVDRKSVVVPSGKTLILA